MPSGVTILCSTCQGSSVWVRGSSLHQLTWKCTESSLRASALHPHPLHLHWSCPGFPAPNPPRPSLVLAPGTLHTPGISPSLHGLCFGETNLRSNPTPTIYQVPGVKQVHYPLTPSRMGLVTTRGTVVGTRGNDAHKELVPCLTWSQPSLLTLPCFHFHH